MEAGFVGDAEYFVASDVAVLFVEKWRPPLDRDGSESVDADGQRLRRTGGNVFHRHDADGVGQLTDHGVVERL